MKFHFLLLVLLTMNYTFGQTIEWAIDTGGATNLDTGDGIQLDSQGFVYVTGNFRKTVSFDPNSNNYDFTAVQYGNGYIQKFDPDGNFLWAKNLNVKSPKMVIDQNDDIFISGTFTKDTDFDPSPAIDLHTTVPNRPNLYLIKLDKDGNYIFGKHFEKPEESNTYQYAINVDRNNNIVISGFFYNTTDFDFSPTQTHLVTPVNGSAFLLKLNSHGEFIWVREFPGTLGGALNIRSLAFDSNNNIVAVGGLRGSVTSSVDVDPGPGTVFLNTPSINNEDVTVIKLTENGDYIWARKATGYGIGNPNISASDFATSVEFDSSDDIVFSGIFRNQVNFEPTTTNFFIDNGVQACDQCYGPHTSFLAKMSGAGDMVWAKSLPSTGSNFGGVVKLAPNGTIFWGANYHESISYEINGTTETHTSSPHHTFSLVQVDPSNGNVLRIKNHNNDLGNLNLRGMVFDGTILYATGHFMGTVAIDGITINGSASTDILTLKYNTLVLDFDLDTINDIDDLDDDNDGILDSVEQNGDATRDTDLDGLPDHQDLDSDGDGCFDVEEAGFLDGDNNGTLGNYPDTVAIDGLIVGEPDGYTEPADTEPNGTPDFQESQNISAGEDSNIDLCEDEMTVDLFQQLGGSPQLGGAWDPALASGTNMFDPKIDIAGNYSYKITSGSCFEDTAVVNVTIHTKPNAGANGTVEICTNDNPIDLFNSLGGMPNEGGSWTPTLGSGNGIFDPMSDKSGIYTYTIQNTICGNSDATVAVTVDHLPNAGEDITTEVCSANGPLDLFDILPGNPDSGGTWSPLLTSGTGIFDPSIDPIQEYSYTIDNAICGSVTSTVTLMPQEQPDAGNDISLEICVNAVAVDLLTVLQGTPEAGGVWSPSLSSNTGVFDPLTDASGTYTYTIETNCNIASSSVEITVTQSQLIEDYEIEITPNKHGTNDVVALVNRPFEFSLDGTEFQEKNSFENLSGGVHTIYGREINGCGLFEKTINLLEYPNFFTPNNDGINDEWKLIGEVDGNYQVYIFDRYGKLIFQLNKDNSWDGEYQGRSLPSSDYWFKVFFDNQSVVTGHFTLKR